MLSTSIAQANPVPVYPSGYVSSPGPTFSEFISSAYQNLPEFLIGIIFVIIFEIIFGYLLFFRNKRKGLFAILIANVISFPLFYLWSTWVSLNMEGLGIILFTYIIGEISVIIIEAILIKLILKNEIKFMASFIASLILNILSLIGGSIFLTFFA